MSAIQKLKIFYYENQIYASMRQATGTLLPAVVIGGFFNHYMAGVSMTFGAFCLAMIDQSGGQRKNRIREFLSAIVLCTLVAFVSSLSSSSMPFLLATVVLVCFSCGMLNVFGPRWGLVALTGLYVMILNVREPTVGMAIFWNSFYIFLGTVFYFVYTLIVRRYAYLNEERRAVFSAMMSTATYVRKRANLYNIQTDLAQAYDVMFNTRANMTTQFQTATDVLLSNFAKRRKRDAAELDKLQHLLANTMGIADALIATQTDYKALHQQVGESQFIDLCHETLNQLANNLESLANHAIHRNKKIHIELPTNNLKVISEDIRTFHKQGRFDADPAFRRLILQIVRRIRNVYFLVKRTAQLQPSKPQSEKFERFLQSSLSNVLSPQKPFNWALLKSNLNLNSSSFRYAIRLSIAGLVGILVPLFLSMFFYDQLLQHEVIGCY